MAKPIGEHEGKKYLRKIQGRDPRDLALRVDAMVDVYDVVVAFNATCPGRQQAIKKLLMAGERGKGDQLADLIGADAALSRAIELLHNRRDSNVNTLSHGSVVTMSSVTAAHIDREMHEANRQIKKQRYEELIIPTPPPANTQEPGIDGTHV